MKTKIILKLEKDLNDNQLDKITNFFLKALELYQKYQLKELDKTKFEILTHKGGVNVPQISVHKGEIKS